MRLFALALLPLAALAQPVFAQPVPAQEVPRGQAEAAECVAAQIAGEQPVADCLSVLHNECLQFEEGAAAGIVCFQRAKEDWGTLIGARMQRLVDEASEEVSAIAGIEVKYDLQMNLLQCDRMEALRLVTELRDQTLLHQRARCEATAAGLSYIKLLAQSQRLDAAE